MDFQARMFSHELDHLRGIPPIHWKVSEGEIEIIENINQMNNLQVTIDYYKCRLRDAKLAEPSAFERLEIPMINSESSDIFEEKLLVNEEFKKKKNLSFQDIMLVDIEKAIRKDLKIKLKQEYKK
jgi:hypothetical protein